MCKLKCFGNEIDPGDLRPFRFSEQLLPFIGNDFIHDIPGINMFLIPPNDRMDMLFDSSIQRLLINEASVFVLE
ncbi:hypothetical protein D3C77_688310 [compost metagenome]